MVGQGSREEAGGGACEEGLNGREYVLSATVGMRLDAFAGAGDQRMSAQQTTTCLYTQIGLLNRTAALKGTL